jgi:hypothetical protein
MRPDEVDLFGLPPQLEAKPRLSPLGPTPEQEGEELIRRYEERYGKDIPPPSVIPVEPTLREQIEQQIAGVLSDDERRGLQQAQKLSGVADFLPIIGDIAGVVDVFDAETPTEAGIIGAATLLGMTPPGKVVKNVKPPKQMNVFAPRGNEKLYSPSEEAALNLKMSKGSGQAFINALIKQGAKPQELKDLGVYDKFQNVKNVTLKEVQDFIAKPSMLDGRNIQVQTLRKSPTWDGSRNDPDFQKYLREEYLKGKELEEYDGYINLKELLREAERAARNKRVARQDLALELRDTDEDIFEPVVDESGGSFNLLDDVDVALNDELLYAGGREFDLEFINSLGEDGDRLLEVLFDSEAYGNVNPYDILRGKINRIEDEALDDYGALLYDMEQREPQFGNYTVRGRKEDYEEHLLKLKPDFDQAEELGKHKEELRKILAQQYDDAFEDALTAPNSRKRRNEAAADDLAKYYEREIALLEPKHFALRNRTEPELNHFTDHTGSLLSHFRSSIRRDDEGNKVFFIDEIQSEQAQELDDKIRTINKTMPDQKTKREDLVITPENLQLQAELHREANKLKGRRAALIKAKQFFDDPNTDLTERVKDVNEKYFQGQLVTPESPKQSGQESIFQFEGATEEFLPIEGKTFDSREEAFNFYQNLTREIDELGEKTVNLDKRIAGIRDVFMESFPDAPFATTDPSAWSSLTIQKAIQKAGESGADKIMLPNGKDMAVLFRTGQRVSKIELSKHSKKYLTPRALQGEPMPEREVFQLNIFDRNGRILEARELRDMPNDELEKELAKVIGKSQAKQLLDAPTDLPLDERMRQQSSGVFENIPPGADVKTLDSSMNPDLFFGGEGMIEYYDRVYPNALKKIVKPFGGKLERMKLRDNETGMGITITPELRKAAEEGFPLYAQGGEVKSAANDVDIFDLSNAFDFNAYRKTGEPKSQSGWLGPIKNNVTGGTMTELSIGVEINNQEFEIPSLVPTLNKKEIEHLANRNPEGGLQRSIPIEESIIQKATDHAIPFLQKGQTPFFRDPIENIGYNLGGAVSPFFDEQMQPIMQPEQPELPTAAQLAYFGTQLLPFAATVESMGEMAEPPPRDAEILDIFEGEKMLSLPENIREGNPFTAGMQGLGVVGDALTFAGPAAAAIGAVSRVPRAIEKTRKAFSTADELPKKPTTQMTGFGLQDQAGRVTDAPAKLREKGGKRYAKFLTETELPKLAREPSARAFLGIRESLPKAKELATVSEAGLSKRKWYQESARALVEIFGDDAPRFAGILAATSPQTSVQSNLLNTLNIFKSWEAAGRPSDPRLYDLIDKPGVGGAIRGVKRVGSSDVPISEKEAREIFIKAGGDDELFDLAKRQLQIMGDSVEGEKGVESVLGAWVNNSIRSLNVPDESIDRLRLSGPKVDSFMRNLAGNTIEVTNDTWIANYLGIEQNMFSGSLNAARTDPGKGPAYLATNALTRESAGLLSQRLGELVTPENIQEMTWSWSKALVENAANKSMTPIEYLRTGQLEDTLVNDVPDFSTLLRDPDLPYRSILEDTGLQVGEKPSIIIPEGSKTADLMKKETSRRDLERAARRLGKIKNDSTALSILAPVIVMNAIALSKDQDQPEIAIDMAKGGSVAAPYVDIFD